MAKKLLIVLVLFITANYSFSQSKEELDLYRKNFDLILYSPDTELKKIERFKTEIPESFYQQKGFYVLTKAMELRNIRLLDFFIEEKKIPVSGDADVTHENLLFYLPYDDYSVVKPGYCSQQDSSFDIRKELANYLVKKGVPINHTNANGMNIMITAMYKKDLETLKFLYELNQKKFVQTSDNNLLYYASYIGCIDFTKWLLENGMDVNLPNKYEGSAIGAAIRRPEIVKLLIEKGANVNLANGYGWTPLMYAANYGNLESLKLLVEAGADLTLKNSKGWDVFYVAKEYKQKEALKYLKSVSKK